MYKEKEEKCTLLKIRKKGEMNMLREQKGITLVALVITVIIIIILATVAINFAFGNNGLITRAEQARDFYANDTIYTEQSVTNVESYLAELMPEEGGDGGDEPITPPAPTGPTVPEEWDTSVVEPVLADENIYVPVPKGFTASKADGETSINEGFVIYQGTEEVNNDNVATAKTSRNQFVWIPVDDTSLGEMYNTTGGEQTLCGGVTTKASIYSNLRVRSGDTSSFSPTVPGTTEVEGTKGIREPDVLRSYDTESQYYQTILGYGSTQAMADGMVVEYNATYQSIAKYDGFYIGRYELTGSVESPTVQKGKTVLSADIAGNWYQLYKACKNVVVAGEEYGAQSEMIYGNQWDEVMDWLKQTEFAGNESKVDTDSSSWGNYNNSSGDAATDAGSKQTSGKNEAWQANNIYDLAGNCYEWTQEADGNTGRVSRGGVYYDSGSGIPASVRCDNSPYYSFSGSSSRPALYISSSES